jgi:hypothetical protein
VAEDERANDANQPAGAVAACGEPTGTANATAVLFEEEGQYGPIFILQLADFLRALGTRSARTLSCMQVVCETVFHKHLGPKGTYSLHGGAFFIFRFGRLDAAEARQRARQAVDEIGRRLLGDHFLPFAEEDGADAPHAASDAVRAAAREVAGSDWEVSPDASLPADGAEGDGNSRARQRREAHTQAREASGKGGGTSASRTTSRVKRTAAT